jgi:hypothetical protein
LEITMSFDQNRLLRAASRAARAAGNASSKEEFVNAPAKSSRRASRLGLADGGTGHAADHGEGSESNPFLVADGSDYAAGPAPLHDVQVEPAFVHSPSRPIQPAIERSPLGHLVAQLQHPAEPIEEQAALLSQAIDDQVEAIVSSTLCRDSITELIVLY